MKGHSILPPSSAARRKACPGSRFLEEQFKTENVRNDAADEGVFAHQIAAAMLAGESISTHDSINTEIIEGAELYVTAIKEKVGIETPLFIEQSVTMKSISQVSFGTPDCFAVKDNTLFVFDYKFGHKQVEVFENWQLLEYAIGCLDYIQDTSENIINVELCIIQPRCFSSDKITTWALSTHTLKTKYLPVIIAFEKSALDHDARCNPSPECTYCSARHACEALQQASLSIVGALYKNYPHQLSPPQAAQELNFLQNAVKILEARITGLEQEVISHIKEGQSVPFFTLANGIGREKWNAPIEEILSLGDLFNIDLRKQVEPITPRQAAKLGLPEDLISTYTERAIGALKLIKTDAKKVFNSY